MIEHFYMSCVLTANDNVAEGERGPPPLQVHPPPENLDTSITPLPTPLPRRQPVPASAPHHHLPGPKDNNYQAQILV